MVWYNGEEGVLTVRVRHSGRFKDTKGCRGEKYVDFVEDVIGIDPDYTCWFDLIETISKIVPWSSSSALSMRYKDPKSRASRFLELSNEAEMMTMFNGHMDGRDVEIIVGFIDIEALSHFEAEKAGKANNSKLDFQGQASNAAAEKVGLSDLSDDFFDALWGGGYMDGAGGDRGGEGGDFEGGNTGVHTMEDLGQEEVAGGRQVDAETPKTPRMLRKAVVSRTPRSGRRKAQRVETPKKKVAHSGQGESAQDRDDTPRSGRRKARREETPKRNVAQSGIGESQQTPQAAADQRKSTRAGTKKRRRCLEEDFYADPVFEHVFSVDDDSDDEWIASSTEDTSESTDASFDSDDAFDLEIEDVQDYEGPNVEVDNQDFEVGSDFNDHAAFRFQLAAYCLRKDFKVKFLKSDPTRITARCASDGCVWRIHASRLAGGATFRIKTLSGIHTCNSINRVDTGMAKQRWIAKFCEKWLRENPTLSVKDVSDRLWEEFTVRIPYLRVYRGRNIALDSIFGKVELTYPKVPSLVYELKSRNPGSVIDYVTEKDDAFLRIFICFKASIDGFKNGCRPFLGFDGCHLKGKYLGTLLAATALDGTNGLFPVAFCICEDESIDSWTYFMDKLHTALGFECGRGLAIISDAQKGLEGAMTKIFPEAEHRACMRHVYKNFKKVFPGEDLEKLVWSAARAYERRHYLHNMNEIQKLSTKAFEYLESLSQTWSRHQFREAAQCAYITNNLSESFNAWISKARHLPLCELVDWIRQKIMTMMDARRCRAAHLNGDLVPQASEYVMGISRDLQGFIVRRSSDQNAEVETPYGRYVIDIVAKKCTCNRWQISGLPCRHAAAVLSSIRGVRWEDYISHYYTLQTYRKCYEFGIAPLPDKDFWAVVKLPYVVGAPRTKRPPGRPKKNRIRSKDEVVHKPRVRHNCARCGGYGHHKNTCKEPINRPPTAQPSERQQDTQTSNSAIAMASRSGTASTKRPVARPSKRRQQDRMPRRRARPSQSLDPDGPHCTLD